MKRRGFCAGRRARGFVLLAGGAGEPIPPGHVAWGTDGRTWWALYLAPVR